MKTLWDFYIYQVQFKSWIFFSKSNKKEVAPILLFEEGDATLASITDLLLDFKTTSGDTNSSK